MRLDRFGVIEGVHFVLSPNADARPVGMPIELIVIHNISLPAGHFGGTGIEALFLNRLDSAQHPFYAPISPMRVSSHFLIRRTGELQQWVACLERAWHAGVSEWRGRQRCNDFSIGIELEGTDTLPYEPAQYQCLRALVRALKATYPIVDIQGHSDIAPSRKTDPGPAFDWFRLQGL